MSLILSGLVAYAGVYAGVFLGSLSAEELPFGRFRFRVMQLVLSGILAIALVYQTLFHGQLWALLLVMLLATAEFLGVFSKQQLVLPKEKTLVVYGVLALVFLFLFGQQGFFVAGIILLYGLITGSLIAEPYVEDRKLIPWDKPYAIAGRWTWAFPAILLLGALVTGTL